MLVKWDHPRRMARGGSRKRRRSGLALAELLVYGAVWIVVATVALGGFFRSLTQARSVRRQADLLTQSLQAGERWRADIRLATAPPRLADPEPGDDRVWVIPQGTQSVTYVLSGTNLYRLAEAKGLWHRALAGVRTCDMVEDRRTRVRAWRWDVELMAPRADGRLKPRFSFVAVPGFAKEAQP